MDEKNFEFLEMPLVVIEGKVMFANLNTSFVVTKLRGISAIGEAISYENQIFVTAQLKQNKDVSFDNAQTVGVVCRIKSVAKTPDNKFRVFVESLFRGVAISNEKKVECDIVTISREDDFSVDEYSERQNAEMIKDKLVEYNKLRRVFTEEALSNILSLNSLSNFINAVAYELPIKIDEKQNILAERVILERLRLLATSLWTLFEYINFDKKIAQKVKESIDKGQKDYYLREQLKAIHEELGDDENEIEKLRSQLIDKNLPEEVIEKAFKELDRMRRMSTSSPDYAVLRNYIDNLIDLPFNEETTDTEDVSEAIKILDEAHFGLEKVKQRIIEYIAVMKLTGKISGNILCLVGPPGVGKTSVATSISNALNRRFVRMSLGGVKDEAEIRGHRKTYIGAMPGRIINGLKIAKSSNPVFLLDEIDKLSQDLRGDPASALLEVLDPEQNKTFRDRYMEIPYDLSKVLFITTANSLEPIPGPLLDRMEVIELDGYTEEEKVEIAKRYLISKRAKLNGLRLSSISFTDEAIKFIIRGYTKEAGVRNLERQIDAVCRKIATIYATNKKQGKRKITEKVIPTLLGSPRYIKEDEIPEFLIGSAQGLAWTAYGGTTLNIEVALVKGKGEVVLTGKLGDVMKESAVTAINYIRANSTALGVDDDALTNKNIHVHVPEGATPKDGPSAGITIATAVLSALTGKKVFSSIAMTGEITLQGNVLAIGGLKEKALAAYRKGVKNIIIPYANKKDIEDIPKAICEQLNFIPVKRATEVFSTAIQNFGE